MARLVVQAVQCESALFIAPGETPPATSMLHCYVSVSRADDGAAVTGLGANNFRITAPNEEHKSIASGLERDYKLIVDELKLSPHYDQPSGIYLLKVWFDDHTHIGKGGQQIGFISGDYVFGIQVSILHSLKQFDYGQTVISVHHIGFTDDIDLA